jgi:hypothetical protein
MFDHFYSEKPSCIDAAYERSAIRSGLVKSEDALFHENRAVSTAPWVPNTTAQEKQHILKDPHDPVNKPSHYTYGKIEAIDVIEDWHLNFNRGNALKYIARAGHKHDTKEDLEKAVWYLKRELSKYA